MRRQDKRLRQDPTLKRIQPPTAAQVAAGVIAIDNWGKNASKETLNDPVLTSMAMALMDAVKRAKPGQDDEPLAMAVGMAMAAACEYGRLQARVGVDKSE